MKKEDMALLAVAVAVAVMALRIKKGKAKGGAKQINVPDAAGWQYFSDGTAIGPDGTYYYKGEQVYDPQADFRNAF